MNNNPPLQSSTAAAFQGFGYPVLHHTTSSTTLGQSSNSSLYNFVQAQSTNFYPHPPIDAERTGKHTMKQGQTRNSEGAGPSRGKKIAMKKHLNVKEESDDYGLHGKEESKRKRTKRTAGKACVYCRRSHMVCEGGRPCERCIKREISHLCRDCTPPPHNHSKDEPQQQQQLDQPPVLATSQQMPLYPEPNFTPSWPSLPDANAGNASISFSATEHLDSSANNSNAGSMGPPIWGTKGDGELAALNKFMKDLGVPNLPNDLLAFMNQLEGQDDNQKSLRMPSIGNSNRGGVPIPPSGQTMMGKGKGKLQQMSRIDKYLMAAADQPNGTRASRLAQVIKAKYDAGLLKPYDYVKGYERMNKWMESGRAAPKIDSRANSEVPESPQQRSRGARSSIAAVGTPASAFGKSISPESRRRILAALAGFRPKFRQIALTLTNVDLVFVEEAMERWMLEYDRALASIHTPSCIWRRTGEIQKANQEFSNLTGVPASMFRDGQLCVYELMDEDSAVRYWEEYAKIAFDPSQRAFSISCTLHIPLSLTQHCPRHLSNVPSAYTAKSATSHPPYASVVDLALPPMYGDGYSDGGVGVGEEYRKMKCMFSVTIRRDAWGVPVAIMGQWIPIQ
ncbi:hypothetical protein L204_101628 [Cryptococcus depauperatus]|nr:transcriptional regulatory protein [Cryptococcus depauperatus CBS 7855]